MPSNDHHHLFALLPHGVIYFAPDGHIRSANPAALSILGLSQAAISGLDQFAQNAQTIHLDGSPLPHDAWPVSTVLRTHQAVQHLQLGMVRPGAQAPLWLNVCAYPVFKPKRDELDFVIVTLEDISDRINTEKALQESHARFSTIADKSPIGILIHRDNRIAYLNPEAVGILGGQSESDFLGNSVLSIIHPDHWDYALARISTIHQFGITKPANTKFLNRAGMPVPVEVRGVSTKLHGQSVIVIFFSDISERLNAEGRLHLLSDITQNATLGVAIIKAADHRIFFTNAAFDKMFGYASQELYERPISVLNAPTHLTPEATAAEINQQLADHGYWQGEVLSLKKDGTSFWTEANVFTFEHASLGTLWITYQQDISARKGMERDLTEQQTKLDRLLQRHVAAQTAAAIAHELNQPLLAISAYSETVLLLLQNEAPNLEKIKIATQATRAQTLRAGKAIHDMLEFLREPNFATDTFDICQLLEETVTTCRTEHSLVFEFVLHGCQEPSLVQVNRLQLHKAILNLLHNSADAMLAANSPKPTITASLTAIDRHTLQITLQDNGPGVADTAVPHLFEQFFSTKKVGMGMGLSISRSLIEANHGELWYGPCNGTGAIFHFTLPLAT